MQSGGFPQQRKKQEKQRPTPAEIDRFPIGLLLASTESEECHQPHADQDQAGGLGNEDGRNFDAVNPSTRRIARGRLTASREAFTTDTGEHKDTREHKDFAFATEDEVSVKRGNVDVADRLDADRVVTTASAHRSELAGRVPHFPNSESIRCGC